MEDTSKEATTTSTSATTTGLSEERVTEAAWNYVRSTTDAHDSLLDILQSKDRHELVASATEGDALAEAFVKAIRFNQVNLVQAFLDCKINTSIKSRLGETPLMVAITNCREESVRWLLDHGANVDGQQSHGTTALMLASLAGKYDLAEMLLQKNANPDLQNRDGMTALMCASSNGHSNIVELLLNHNADKELKNNRGLTALRLATTEKTAQLLRNQVTSSYVLK